METEAGVIVPRSPVDALQGLRQLLQGAEIVQLLQPVPGQRQDPAVFIALSHIVLRRRD